MAWRTFEDFPACQECGKQDVDIISSEKYDETIRRTRHCPDCYQRWKTYETNPDNHSVIGFKVMALDDSRFKRKKKENAAFVRVQMGLFV
jgi:transcriptional regulator NrdR family protein